MLEFLWLTIGEGMGSLWVVCVRAALRRTFKQALPFFFQGRDAQLAHWTNCAADLGGEVLSDQFLVFRHIDRVILSSSLRSSTVLQIPVVLNNSPESETVRIWYQIQ